MKAKRIFINFLLAAIAFVAFYVDAKHVVDIYDLTLEQNLALPVVKKDVAKKVQDYQYKLAVDLITKQDYDVETTRNNEVLIITIPAEKLFAPNDSVLTESGKGRLKPLLKFLKNQGFYKILLEMHSDNTGSANYTMNLTRSRVGAVYDWIEEHGSVDFVVPYAAGMKDPVVDNNSMSNRKANRRLEIYLVPGEVMLEQAKKGRININTVNVTRKK